MIFFRFRASQERPKIDAKMHSKKTSQKNIQKKDFGLHFGLQIPPLGASWPSLGHFWTPSGWSWAPSGGILALREAPGWIFEASKGVWGQLLACLLATIFAYNCWIDLLHELLHETHHGIHLGFSFTPCSAAVRAQHMELKPSWLLKPQKTSAPAPIFTFLS